MADLLQKCGPTEEQTIYHHPMTKRHMGFARVVFMDVRSARDCIEKYNGKSVMGKELLVFHDAFGTRCKQIFQDVTAGRPLSSATAASEFKSHPGHSQFDFQKSQTVRNANSIHYF